MGGRCLLGNEAEACDTLADLQCQRILKLLTHAPDLFRTDKEEISKLFNVNGIIKERIKWFNFGGLLHISLVIGR